jgi:hypothetical protein
MVVCATAIDAGTKLLLSLLFLLFLFIANPVVDVLTDVACVVVPSTAVSCVNVVRYVFVCDNGDAVEIDSEFGAVLVGENVVGADFNVAIVCVCVCGVVGGIVTVAFSADAVGAVSVMRVGEIEQVFWIWSATDVDAHVDAVAYGAEAVDKVFVDVNVGVSSCGSG